MIFMTREDVIKLTPLWKGERSEDGRPYVADTYLDKLKSMDAGQINDFIRSRGYNDQVVRLDILSEPNAVLIGRALTASYAPMRPDFHNASIEIAKEHGYEGDPKNWLVDKINERDVVVIDLFPTWLCSYTFLDADMVCTLQAKTKNGGILIDGPVYNVEKLYADDSNAEQQDPIYIDDLFLCYERNTFTDTYLCDVSMSSMNGPALLTSDFTQDTVTCLPGDIVLTEKNYVMFIPPHLAVEFCENEADLNNNL